MANPTTFVEEKTLTPRKTFTYAETAKILGISLISVKRLVARGKIKVNKALPGRPLISALELDRFANSRG